MVNIKVMKKKRVSKKTKDSWRKHVNINDVEEFLEEKRTDERLGDPIETLPDEELFVIETKPINFTKQGPKEKRKLLYNKPPKCFQILQSTSKVPDPITKRNRVRTKEERKSKITKAIEDLNRKKGIVKERDRIAQLHRLQHKIKKEASTYKKGDFNRDLWTVEDVSDIQALRVEWNNNTTIRHNLKGLGKLRKLVPKSVTDKKSMHPNVELPHAGTSYNPSLEDHLNLLKDVAEKEEKIIKQEKHIERVTTKVFKKVTTSNKEQSWIVEMAEGLNPIKGEVNSDEEQEFKSINPPVLNKKKDRKQKRKQKEQRELKEVLNKAKIEKKKISDIYRLKQFNKQIQNKERHENLVQEKRKVNKEKKELITKRLSKRKFEEPELEFNMGQDISGNLRNVKFEGNLLLDRFKSLQKRNILEPTVLQIKKRGKVKKFEKATHKMGWEPKGY